MARGYRAGEILLALRRLPSPRPAAADFSIAMLGTQAEVEAAVMAPALTGEEARARTERGLPLLPDPFTSSVISPEGFRALAARVCVVFATFRPDLAEALDAGLEARDRALVASVVAHTVRGFLRPLGSTLGPLVDERRWLRGECPVCGDEPDFAALAGDGERRLLCRRCDTEWAYRRIACPFCGMETHDRLGYHPSGDAAYRLYVCAGCARYLKTVDLRQRPGACPPAERVLTLGLDVAAIESGYRAGEPNSPTWAGLPTG